MPTLIFQGCCISVAFSDESGIVPGPRLYNLCKPPFRKFYSQILLEKYTKAE